MDDMKFFGDYKLIYPGQYDNMNKGVKKKLIELISEIKESRDINWGSMQVIVKNNEDNPLTPATVAIKYKAKAKSTSEWEEHCMKSAEKALKVDKENNRTATALTVPVLDTILRIAKRAMDNG